MMKNVAKEIVEIMLSIPLIRGVLKKTTSFPRYTPEAAKLRGRYGSRATRFEPIERESRNYKLLT